MLGLEFRDELFDLNRNKIVYPEVFWCFDTR